MLSRIAKNPLQIPAGVEVKLNNNHIMVNGKLGKTELIFNDSVRISQQSNELIFSVKESTIFARALSGTVKALVTNMINGVTTGFTKKLTIIGVGYKAQVQSKLLNLTLGYSHPIVYNIPEGITIETPTPLEVIIKGIDKQLVGQVSADIRSFRPVEPYKGKGIRYSNEQISLKETKKK